MSTKERAIEALRDLPEDASWAEIEGRIHFLAAIEKGRQDLKEGKTNGTNLGGVVAAKLPANRP